MVKLKYAPGLTPLRNEHCGCTFQNSRIGQTAMNGQRNDRERQSRQMNKKANLMHAVTNWRNFPPGSKTNWNNFATNYPQPCKNPDSGFLTGYQLFIKRQQYLFLNEGIQSEFLEAPFSEVLILDNYTFTVDQTENCLDVTENYIRNFGLIPSPGQFMLIKVLAYAVKSGQFFPVVTQTIEILESYIDGLFISLHLPVNCRDTVFSVYLSKPVHQSVVYSGTKTRYMGCFTTKTFLGLTDTPDSYEDQAGKIVSVKADESGLEFTNPSAGGLTCETLVNCPTIITIKQDILNLQNTIVQTNFIAIPALVYGLLYNLMAVLSIKGLAATGWRVMHEADWRSFELASGYPGTTIALQHITTPRAAPHPYWSAGIPASTNTSKMSFVPNGQRTSTGVFQNLLVQSYNWVGERYWIGSQNSYYRDITQSIYGYNVLLNLHTGMNCRLRKITTTLTNGQTSVYHGNDGKVYPTVCWNNIEYLAAPLAETKYADGSLIPFAGANGINFTNAEWAALSGDGVCPYNNDWSLVSK